MKVISLRGLWAGLLAVGALGAVALATGTATAGTERAANGGATIKMKLDGGRPYFQGPKSVGAGERLRVVNRTAPNRIGPHTFSLIKERLLPRTARQKRRCGSLEYKPCLRVFESHEVDPKTFEIGEPKPDKGRTGWDRGATRRRQGDSFYTETRGERHGRKVKAEAGDTLAYFCLIHPRMQGTIKVK